jgi:release factor glutamine methyltransferase
MLRIIDVGTGSGCIAITIALTLHNCAVIGTDVDSVALEVASQNAMMQGAQVKFISHNILWEDLPSGQDVIVSNPPYILMREQSTMNNNVLMYEPHRALFVDDEDPLVFYRALAERSRKSLKPGGMLGVEINEQFGRGVAAIFEKEAYSEVSVIKDIFNKDRVVTGFRN